MVEDLLVYPTNKVVGVAVDADTLGAVTEELRASGVAEDRFEVLRGSRDAETVDPDPGEHGPIGAAIRVVQHVLGEETPRLATLHDALEAGAFVVQVEVPEDQPSQDVEKRRVGEALIRAGATEVAFYGPNAIEEIQLGA